LISSNYIQGNNAESANNSAGKPKMRQQPKQRQNLATGGNGSLKLKECDRDTPKQSFFFRT
jgi:hypothetical protein